MHKLYELKDKLMNELEDYSENGKFSKDDAENIKALSASIEHICNICKDAEEEEDGYSGRMYPDGMGGSYRGYSRDNGRMGRNGYSMARGRMNARRDSMGRYSGADGMEDMETVKTEVRRLAEKIEQM